MCRTSPCRCSCLGWGLGTAADKILAAIHDTAFVAKLVAGRHLRTLMRTAVDAPKDTVGGWPLTHKHSCACVYVCMEM
jgi:hypothetical protein